MLWVERKAFAKAADSTLFERGQERTSTNLYTNMHLCLKNECAEIKSQTQVFANERLTNCRPLEGMLNLSLTLQLRQQ